MKISQSHTNRQHHNWLVYNINDHFLQKHSPSFKGVLYDLGAGESPYKEFFLNHAQRYVAVDWTSSYHNIQVDVAADLNKPLPIDTEVADSVVSLSVLEHLSEPQTMLNEAFRILKPGGTIVLQVPWQWWIHEAPYDYFRFTPYALKLLFEKAGFTDIIVEPQSGFCTMWLLKINYFTLRFIRGPLLLRRLIKVLLLPFWYLGQFIAPWLDKLDRNWSLETIGFFVVAKKTARS